MEVRKIVKSGNTSHVIAIPKYWLEKNHIKRGDKIYITETEDHNLLLSTRLHNPSKIEKKELTINLENTNPFSLRRIINASYISDYSHIIIKGKELMNNLDVIKGTITSLIAFEVVEESQEVIIAKNFLDLSSINIQSLIRRIDRILISMIEDLQECCQNRALSKVIHDRDTEINKLGYLVFKILRSAFKNSSLARELGLKNLDIGIYSQLNMHLEKMGDKIKLTAQVATKSKKGKVDIKEFKKLISEIEKVYLNIMKAFYTNNKFLADEVARQRQKLHKMSEQFYLKKENAVCSEIKTHFKAFISHVIDISRLIRYMMD